jgi:carboxypeptidase C (cathepsin A)
LLIGQQNQPLADSVLIPTFAATAWYHGRLWPEKELEDVIEYARRFTYEDYLPVMMEPTRLSPFERREFYNRFALLCGLPPSTVSRYLARFDEDLFTREFMADERKLIGGLDTRYIGDVSGIDNHDFEQDPSYKDMQGILCAFNQYLQTDLQLMNPFDPYTPYSRQSWNFSSYDSFSWPDLLQRVRRTLIRTPEMQIFSGSGYYDCRTPFAATEHAFAHLELPSSYDKNLHFHYYEGGHGFVFDPACLKKLHTDLVKFYNVCEPSK